MKHILIAKSDVNERYGDRLITAKKGEKIELSGAGAEIAMRSGHFDYGGEVSQAEAKAEKPAKTESASAKLGEKLNAAPDAAQPDSTAGKSGAEVK